MPIAYDFFVHYAYGILFLWVLVEQLGVPVPSVPLLIAAGTLTATHRIHTVPAMASILVRLRACGFALVHGGQALRWTRGAAGLPPVAWRQAPACARRKATLAGTARPPCCSQSLCRASQPWHHPSPGRPA